jgi:hypothetical protein
MFADPFSSPALLHGISVDVLAQKTKEHWGWAIAPLVIVLNCPTIPPSGPNHLSDRLPPAYVELGIRFAHIVSNAAKMNTMSGEVCVPIVYASPTPRGTHHAVDDRSPGEWARFWDGVRELRASSPEVEVHVFAPPAILDVPGARELVRDNRDNVYAWRADPERLRVALSRRQHFADVASSDLINLQELECTAPEDWEPDFVQTDTLFFGIEDQRAKKRLLAKGVELLQRRSPASTGT